MLEAFKNQYWTRLISMEDFRPGEQERYELGPDVAAEAEDMHRLDLDEMPAWAPLFDPQRFQEEHQQPLLKDWNLEQAELLDLANEVVEIRAAINRKAELNLHVDDIFRGDALALEEPAPVGFQREDDKRSRRGLKHSTAARHP